MIKAPCMDCRNRQIGCHGKCELYKHYQEEKRKEKTIMKKFRDEENHMRGYKEEKAKRLKK